MEPSKGWRRSVTCHSSWASTSTAPARPLGLGSGHGGRRDLQIPQRRQVAVQRHLDNRPPLVILACWGMSNCWLRCSGSVRGGAASSRCHQPAASRAASGATIARSATGSCRARTARVGAGAAPCRRGRSRTQDALGLGGEELPPGRPHTAQRLILRMPARLRSCHTVLGATRDTNCTSSPWMRRYPQGRILCCHPQDQAPQVQGCRRSAGWAVWLGPVATDQGPMPTQ
jgi:hypothetical protein